MSTRIRGCQSEVRDYAAEQEILVTFTVDEGPQTRVGMLSSGQRTIPLAQLTAPLVSC